MMKSELHAYVANRAQGGIHIGKTVDLFRRYAYIEQSCVRALAGWFIKAGDWEAKLKLGYHLFAHAERVYELHGRLEELRGGQRDVNIEPGLERFCEELVHAPGESSFIAGLSFALKQLAEGYRVHLDAAHSSANAMEIRIVQRLLPDVEREEAAIGSLKPFVKSDGEAVDRAWSAYLESLLRSCGGISGMDAKGGVIAARPGQALFEWPMPMTFNDRLHKADFGTYESKLNLPVKERCIGEFEVYFNELYAAAVVASVVYESWKISAPRQFFYDMAHHFWDEVRHAEFGAIRLREHGVEPSKVNMVLFEQSQAMPLLHRICYLTLGLEVFFMPRKTERVRYYEEQGDFRSQLFADVDWSEEVNHVRYGKRWVEHFLKDDARSVEDLQAEISQYLEAFSAQLPAGRKAPW